MGLVLRTFSDFVFFLFEELIDYLNTLCKDAYPDSS